MDSNILIIGPVIAVMMAVSLAYSRWRAKYDAISGDLILRYGLPLKIFAVVAVVWPFVPISAALYQALFDKPFDATPLVTLFTPFVVLGLVLFLEAMRIRVTVSDRGIQGLSPWRGPRFIAWEDVTEVSFSALGTCFVFKNREGKPIRVNIYLNGIRPFVAVFTRKLPREVYRKAERGFAQLGVGQSGYEYLLADRSGRTGQRGRGD